MEIDYKSTGTLINELITTKLKIENIGEKEEFTKRFRDLMIAIRKRHELSYLESKLNGLWSDLENTLTTLWWEQEVLYQYRQEAPKSKIDYEKCAMAGINSIALNAKRSKLIRKIDKVLGEESSTVLEKSFR